MLVVSCSPRAGGNCDRLAYELKNRFNGEICYMRDGVWSFCDGCGECERVGACKFDPDGATAFYNRLLSADSAIFVAPVYFSGFDARTKSMLDRAQLYWNKGFSPRVRKPFFLCAVGGQTFSDNFDGIRITMKNFSFVIGVKLSGFVVQNADAVGEIDSHENRAALEKAVAEWHRLLTPAP